MQSNSYTLVIVDMQDMFVASRCLRTRENIIREIKKAKAKRAYIVVVEYYSDNPTYAGIMKAIGAYRKARVVHKNDDDGSFEVINTIPARRLKERHWFKLCGVNTDCCVTETALGLREFFPEANIEIIMKASNTEMTEAYWNITRAVLKNKNIRLR